MPVSRFPRRGYSLAPSAVKPFLLDTVPATKLKYADLDHTIWDKLSEEECFALSHQVIRKLASRWTIIVDGIRSRPLWPASGPIDIDRLYLGVRTLGIAIKLLNKTKGNDIRRLTLGDFVDVGGSGAASLVDWLSAVEFHVASVKDVGGKESSVHSQSHDFGVAKAVVSAAKSRPIVPIHDSLGNTRFPMPAKGLSLEDIGFRHRTFNCLSKAGYAKDPSKIAKLTFADAAKLKGCGATTIADIFESILRANKLHKNRLSRPSGWVDPFHTVLEHLRKHPKDGMPEWIKDIKTPQLPIGFSIRDIKLLPARVRRFEKLGFYSDPNSFFSKTFFELFQCHYFNHASICSILDQIIALRELWNLDDSDDNVRADKARAIIQSILAIPGIEAIDANDVRFGAELLLIFPDLKGFADLREFAKHPLLFSRLERLERLHENLISLHQQTIDREFMDLAVRNGDIKRKSQIVSSKYGLLGSKQMSVAQQEKRFRASHQSIHFVYSEVRNRLAGPAPYSPNWDRALQLLDTKLPLKRSELKKLLVEQQLLHPRSSIESLPELAQILGRECSALPITNSPDPYLANKIQTTYFWKLVEQARTAGLKGQTISVQELVSKSQKKLGCHVPQELVEELLRTITAFKWIESPTGWTGLKSVHKGWLTKEIKKVLFCCPKINVDQLRNALLRDQISVTPVPQAELLLDLCRSISTLTVKGNQIKYSGGGNARDFFSGMEHGIVKYMMSKNYSFKSFPELREHVIKLGATIAMLNSVLTNSTVIERRGYAKYAIIGTPKELS